MHVSFRALTDATVRPLEAHTHSHLSCRVLTHRLDAWARLVRHS